MNKKMTRKQALSEFHQLCYDDAHFNYGEDEFEDWVTDMEIEISEALIHGG